MSSVSRPAHPGRARFAANLRAARKDAGLTQEALANLAGMDRSFYVEVEHGKHSVSVDRILELCDALNIPAGSLFAVSSSAPQRAWADQVTEETGITFGSHHRTYFANAGRTGRSDPAAASITGREVLLHPDAVVSSQEWLRVLQGRKPANTLRIPI